MGTVSKSKKIKPIRQKLKLFRANEPSLSVLMWGINYSSSTLTNVRHRVTLLRDDYKARMKVKVTNLHFNKENMPSHFKFKEYCPIVFKNLRVRFGVDSGDYLMAFNKHQPVWDTMFGKPGSKFLVTYNRQFVAKTISAEDVEQLNQIIEEYYAYIANCNGRTLLPQYLGLYRIRVNDQETYILVMRNIFSPRLPIHKICNLKSKTLSPQKNSDLNDVCKIYLGESNKSMLISVLQSDIQFLTENNLLGYNLLIGLHEVSQVGRRPTPPPPAATSQTTTSGAAAAAAGESREPGFEAVYVPTVTGCDEERGPSAGDGLGSIDSQPMLHRLSLNRVQSPISDDDAGCGGGAGAVSDDESLGDDIDTLIGSEFALGDSVRAEPPSNGSHAQGNSSAETFPFELCPYLEFYGIKSSPDSPRPLVYFLAIVGILSRHGARKRPHRAHGSGQDGGQLKPDAYGRRIMEFISQCIV